MTEKLLWNVGAQAAGGPTISASGVMNVEAYDKFTVVVPKNGTTTVPLGPGGAAMTCLFVSPAQPDPKLSYKIGADDIVLDAPLALLGGAVKLAGQPASLTFKNDAPADAQIEILVGRHTGP